MEKKVEKKLFGTYSILQKISHLSITLRSKQCILIFSLSHPLPSNIASCRKPGAGAGAGGEAGTFIEITAPGGP